MNWYCIHLLGYYVGQVDNTKQNLPLPTSIDKQYP